MAKTKKLLLTALSVALVAIIAVFGTIAYLQDTDSDVNVMTLGEVDIVQHEYQRELNADGTYKTGTVDSQNSYVLEAFEQAKPLYPIVGDPSLSGTGYAGWDTTTVRMSQVDSYGGMQVFAGKNAQDKFVTVENTGKSDAYVRTLVALEVGSGNSDLIGTSYHKTWTKKSIGTIEIDSNKYYLIEYVYAGAKNDDTFLRHENGILPAGDTTYPSLSQVYLKSVATNEDMKALDGNNNGTFDILVLSQAVQTEGFANAKTALDIAFGIPEEKAAEWFGGEEFTIPTTVATAAELKSALESGKDVILNADLNLEEAQITIPAGESVTLNLNGHDINAIQNGTTTYGTFNIVPGATLNVEGNGDVKVATNVTSGISACLFQNDGTLNIYGGNYEANQKSSVAGLGAVIAVIDNCPYDSEAVVNIYGGTFAVTGSGAINIIRNWPIHNGSATLNIYDGVFKANNVVSTTYLWNKDDSTPTTLNSFMNFYGGTYEPNVVYEDYNGQDDIYIAPGVTIEGYGLNS